MHTRMNDIKRKSKGWRTVGSFTASMIIFVCEDGLQLFRILINPMLHTVCVWKIYFFFFSSLFKRCTLQIKTLFRYYHLFCFNIGQNSSARLKFAVLILSVLVVHWVYNRQEQKLFHGGHLMIGVSFFIQEMKLR